MVSKPLQYVNVTNIECEGKKILLLVDSFYDAKRIHDIIKREKNDWEDVIIFPEKKDVYSWLVKNIKSINNLFVDADVGYRSFIYKLRKIKIFIYEEGLGTYVSERRKLIKPINARIYQRSYWGYIYRDIYWFINELIGYKDRIGGDKYIYGLILYYPGYYLKNIKNNEKKIFSFKENFLINLEKSCNKSLFGCDFIDDKYCDKTVLVYLTGWDVMKGLENTKGFDYKIIKPHPHIKDSRNDGYDVCVPGYVMSEYVIIELLKKVKKLVIVSSYSYSVIHFYNNPKISIINSFDIVEVLRKVNAINNGDIDKNNFSEDCPKVFKDIVKYKNNCL
jgi:hypothetical protein